MRGDARVQWGPAVRSSFSKAHTILAALRGGRDQAAQKEMNEAGGSWIATSRLRWRHYLCPLILPPLFILIVSFSVMSGLPVLLEVITPLLLNERAREVKRFAPALSKRSALSGAAGSLREADTTISRGSPCWARPAGALPNALCVSRALSRCWHIELFMSQQLQRTSYQIPARIIIGRVHRHFQTSKLQ